MSGLIELPRRQSETEYGFIENIAARNTGVSETEHIALIEVAKAAAVLFRPPYRRGAGIMDRGEHRDWARLRKALYQDECPVDIGEELT